MSNARLRGVRVWDYFTNEPADDPLFEKEALYVSPAAPSPAVEREITDEMVKAARKAAPKFWRDYDSSEAQMRKVLMAALTSQPATAGEKLDGK